MIENTTAISVPKRNLLFGGLAIALRRLPALLWTYMLSLGIALLFSIRFYGQWNALLSHSLASQSLTSAFDLGTFAGGLLRLSERVPGGNSPSFGGLVLFAIVSFLLVPGTLFCYASAAPARLSTLLRAGIEHFWRFVRITLLTLIVGGVILGPLSALNTALNGKIDDHLVGRPAFLIEILGVVLLFLIATVLRLYFDLVEVYTVQLGLETTSTTRPNTRSDRRVRRTLRPAWRTLTRHFAPAWLTFLLLTVLGLSALAIATRFLIASLAQPRVWPAFLAMQLAILFDLFTRFWQRGAETVLSQNYPLLLAPATSASRFTPAAPPPSVAPLHTSPEPIIPLSPAAEPDPLPVDPSFHRTPPPPIVE